MNRLTFVIALFLGLSGFAAAQKQPNLAETLGWMQRTLANGQGDVHTIIPELFDKDGRVLKSRPFEEKYRMTHQGCEMTLQVSAPEYTVEYGFNLGIIDPTSVRIFAGSVLIMDTQKSAPLIRTTTGPDDTHLSILMDNTRYARRFAYALKHAAYLCGAKPEPF
jgi:hypothetical protein